MREGIYSGRTRLEIREEESWSETKELLMAAAFQSFFLFENERVKSPNFFMANKVSNFSTIKIYKSREGAVWWRTRDTWATCDDRVTAIKMEHFLDSPCFFKSFWYFMQNFSWTLCFRCKAECRAVTRIQNISQIFKFLELGLYLNWCDYLMQWKKSSEPWLYGRTMVFWLSMFQRLRYSRIVL